MAADPEALSRCYPIGMPAAPVVWAGTPAALQDTFSRDGLAAFDSSLFVDEGLRTVLTTSLPIGDAATGAITISDALLDEADSIRYTGPDPRPLAGLHALLGLDEVTLACVPDAVQRGWTLEYSPPATSVESEPPPATATGDFGACAARALTPPELELPQPVGASDGSPPEARAPGMFELSWTPSDAPGANYVLQQSVSDAFEDPTVYYQGPASSITVQDPTAGIAPRSGQWFRVAATTEAAQSPWSNAIRLQAGSPVRAAAIPPEDYSDSTLIEVQRALLRAVAARGDMFAALALPAHYAESQTTLHLRRLFSFPTTSPGPGLLPVPPLAPGEARTLTFGALYHPWTVLADSTGLTPSVPPDVTAVAVMADRALSQGCWVAPGNIPLANAIALTPVLDRTKLPPGAVPQVNVLSQEAIGFVCLSQWTLSPDPQFTDINVRRLLSLLRRVMLLWGPRYVFESNDDYLVHAVARDFEGLLHTLYVGGAFAGDTPAQSYFVNVESGADRGSGLDPGELVVELGVAPSLPMRFLTVQLAQQYGGSSTVGGS
jgi:hypothetical protein